MAKRTAHAVTTRNTTYYVLTRVVNAARSEWEFDQKQTSVWGSNGLFFHLDRAMEMRVGERLQGETGNGIVRTSTIQSVKRITLKEFDRLADAIISRQSQVYF
jgi:hypothetical protein